MWIRYPEEFNFLYRYPVDQLNNYIYFAARTPPQGIFMDFVEDRKEAFQRIFSTVDVESSVSVPDSASLDRYSVVKPKTHIGENVLVAQRAYLQNSWLCKWANTGAVLHHKLAAGRV